MLAFVCFVSSLQFVKRATVPEKGLLYIHVITKHNMHTKNILITNCKPRQQRYALGKEEKHMHYALLPLWVLLQLKVGLCASDVPRNITFSNYLKLLG